MNVKDFLQSHKGLNLSWIASKMYPNQKNARSYLNQKLHNHLPAVWLESDSIKAMDVLKSLSIDIDKLTL